MRPTKRTGSVSVDGRVAAMNVAEELGAYVARFLSVRRGSARAS